MRCLNKKNWFYFFEELCLLGFEHYDLFSFSIDYLSFGVQKKKNIYIKKKLINGKKIVLEQLN